MRLEQFIIKKHKIFVDFSRQTYYNRFDEQGCANILALRLEMRRWSTVARHCKEGNL